MRRRTSGNLVANLGGRSSVATWLPSGLSPANRQPKGQSQDSIERTLSGGKAWA